LELHLGVPNDVDHTQSYRIHILTALAASEVVLTSVRGGYIRGEYGYAAYSAGDFPFVFVPALMGGLSNPGSSKYQPLEPTAQFAIIRIISTMMAKGLTNGYANNFSCTFYGTQISEV
jgi:hypothetical protein